MSDPNTHWDGERWLQWDGDVWITATPQPPPPVALPPRYAGLTPQPTPQPAPIPTPVKRSKAGGIGCLVIIGVVVLIVIVVSIFGSSKSPEDSAKSNSQLTCDHFRNILGDVKAGLLTDAELRDKLKEVNSSAIIATPEIQAAAQKMLAAITGEKGKKLVDEAVKMSAACNAAGF